MRKLQVEIDPKVEEVFQAYPEIVKPKIRYLRKLVLETAEEIESISVIEETLKWGEPSYLTKKGSTIRIDWKKRHQINMPCILNVRVS